MYQAWDLPSSLSVGGEDYTIRTDFRVILDILSKLQDSQYEDDEKSYIFLDILYVDFEHMPVGLYKEAIERGMEWIDAGIENDSKTGKKKPSVMDWEQDAPLIIPAVNRVLKGEVRAIPCDIKTGSGGLHWWTFLGAYMEIGESLYSSIINIREKKVKRKKLEKWELDFYNANKGLVDIHRNEVHNTQEQKDAARELIFGHKSRRE